MKKQDFINWITNNPNWTLDSYGNYRSKCGTYRFKLNATSVRLEKKINHAGTQYSPARTSWIRLRSNYYKNLNITAENKISGMVY